MSYNSYTLAQATKRVENIQCPDCNSPVKVIHDGNPLGYTMATTYMVSDLGRCWVAACKENCGQKAKIPVLGNVPVVFGSAVVRWMRAAAHAVLQETARTRHVKEYTLKRILFFRHHNRLSEDYLKAQTKIDHTIHFSKIDDPDLLKDILVEACGWIGGINKLSLAQMDHLPTFTVTTPVIPELYKMFSDVPRVDVIDDTPLLSPVCGMVSPAELYRASLVLNGSKYRISDRSLIITDKSSIIDLVGAYGKKCRVFKMDTGSMCFVSDEHRRLSNFRLNKEQVENAISSKLLDVELKYPDGTLYKPTYKLFLETDQDKVRQLKAILAIADNEPIEPEPEIKVCDPTPTINVLPDMTTPKKPAKATKKVTPKTVEPETKIEDMADEPTAMLVEFKVTDIVTTLFKFETADVQNGRCLLTFIPSDAAARDLFKSFDGIINAVTGEFSKEIMHLENTYRRNLNVNDYDYSAGAKVFSVILDSRDLAERIIKAFNALYA